MKPGSGELKSHSISDPSASRKEPGALRNWSMVLVNLEPLGLPARAVVCLDALGLGIQTPTNTHFGALTSVLAAIEMGNLWGDLWGGCPKNLCALKWGKVWFGSGPLWESSFGFLRNYDLTSQVLLRHPESTPGSRPYAGVWRRWKIQ